MHNISSSATEIRPTNLCMNGVLAQRKEGEGWQQQTCLIMLCVNGPAGRTRWGPADGFPHCRAVWAVPCGAVAPNPPQLAPDCGPTLTTSPDIINMWMTAEPLCLCMLMGHTRPPVVGALISSSSVVGLCGGRCLFTYGSRGHVGLCANIKEC